MKSYNTTNFTPNAFDNLYDNKNLYQYHTADIGDLLKKIHKMEQCQLLIM